MSKMGFGIILFALIGGASAADLLQPERWTPKQRWMRPGAFFEQMTEGERSFTRLKKAPVVLEQKIPLDGTLAKVKLDAELRLGLEKDGQWGGGSLRLRFLDAAGQPIQEAGAGKFFSRDQDWEQLEREAEVPAEARVMEVAMDYRAKAGTVDLAAVKLEVTATREAPVMSAPDTAAPAPSASVPVPVAESNQRNLLEPSQWAARQSWQKQGQFWDVVKEGDTAFVRVMKNPVLLQQTIDTDGSFAKVKLAADVRISQLQTDGRMGLITMALKFLDADGQVIKAGGAAARFRKDQDWSHEEFEAEVPTDVYALEVWLDYRAAKGHGDFANITLTATELREAPERASRGGTASTPAEVTYAENATWHLDPMQKPVAQWKADIDVDAVQRTIHVAPGGTGDGSQDKPIGSIRNALQAAGQLLKDGVATKLFIADGIYRESWFELNAKQLGGKAKDTLLVVEGQSTDGVRIRGSEVSGFEPANWTLVDEARNIYRIDWTKTELAPVPTDAWSPAIQAISRHRVMVFINGVRLKPVQLEQYQHEKTREEKYEREHGGISTRRTVVDTYTGFAGLDGMTPGTMAVNTLGPGENTFDQHPHDYPNSLLIRMPDDIDFAESRVEVAYSGGGGFRFLNKSNVAVRNLTVEYMSIAGVFFKECDNVLVEGVAVCDNDGGGGACGLRLMNCQHVTVRDSQINRNGPFGLHLAVKFGTIERVQVNGNNWRGGLSGHVMHGDGGCGGKFSHVQFLDSQFNENYGFGLRQDGMGEHAVIERCRFNGNRINGGMMWEITYGPITIRDSQMIGNNGRGIHVNCAHGLTLERCIIVNNSDAQVDIFPMVNRGKVIEKGVPRFSGPTRRPLGGEQDKANWIEGVIATRISECTIAVTEPSITDQPLICGKYWPNNIRYYEDWLKNQLQADGNVYWHAATDETFDAGKARGEQTNYSTLSEWRQVTGQDAGSVLSKPAGTYPLPPKAEVVGEDVPLHRQ